MLVTVEDGRAIEVRGAPDHPTTAGRAVHQGRALPRSHLFARSRAAIRCAASAARAKAASQRITWDEALDEIATRFRRDRGVGRRAAGDPALQLRGQRWALLQGESMDRRFFHRLGASLLDRTICSSAGKAGWVRGHRRLDGHGRRGVREQRADPDLGQQPDYVEPALLDPCAGGQAPRREAGRDRPLAQRDRRQMPRARRTAAGHRRRAGLRPHARADRRRAGRS